jgi:hypothetical protein
VRHRRFIGARRKTVVDNGSGPVKLCCKEVELSPS